eukprot:5404626-Lingulodinium_polyedra.AAC.1
MLTWSLLRAWFERFGPFHGSSSARPLQRAQLPFHSFPPWPRDVPATFGRADSDRYYDERAQTKRYRACHGAA